MQTGSKSQSWSHHKRGNALLLLDFTRIKRAEFQFTALVRFQGFVGLNRTVFGASTMAMASALRVAVQIAILPIIGRLLGPHAYGEVALVSPFVFFSMMLSESGLGACIVRADKVTPALEGTVFCFSAALSLFFIALGAAVAYPLGRFLHEPDFPPLLIGMSSILLLAALNIVPSSLLLRKQKYGWTAASDVAGSVGGLVGVITGLALHWGPWSLVAQQIGLWVAKLIVVFAGTKARPRLIFHWSILRQNFQFGSHLTGSAVLWFVARNIDNILIGKLMGAAVLGYYALAFQIVGIPQMILSGSVYYTVFAGSSEALRQGTSPAPQFLAVLKGVALICLPVIAGLAATSYLSVPLVLGNNWAPVSLLIILLTPFGLSQALSPVSTGLLNGLGETGAALRIGLLGAGATVAAIAAGAFFSSAAIAIGVSVTALIYPLLSMVVLVRKKDISYGEIFGALRAPLIASALMGVGVFFLQLHLSSDLPPVAALGICIAAGIALYAGLLLGLFRDHLSADLALVKRVISRGAA